MNLFINGRPLSGLLSVLSWLLFSLELHFSLRKHPRSGSHKRETSRRAEIAFTQALNNIYDLLENLDQFCTNVRKIIKEVRKVSDSSTFVLDFTNFPAIPGIYLDKELMYRESGSLYLHNAILNINRIITQIDENTSHFRDEYARLLGNNREMALSKLLTPEEHRKSYAKNLSRFIEMVEGSIDSTRTNNIKFIVKAKIYNLKLHEKLFRTILKYEGRSFKYFENRKAYIDYSVPTTVLDRINEVMEPEADRIIKILNTREEMKKRDNS